MNVFYRFIPRRKSATDTLPVAEKPNRETRLFVHIPKTGGTSFRRSSAEFLGCEKVLCDYGRNSIDTSPEILSAIYEAGDIIALEQSMNDLDIALICGHFNAAKYAGFIGLLNSATIFRHPVDRVVSHYLHAVNYQEFAGDFLSFAQKSENQNMQSKYVSGLDPALFGVVVITENFQSSIDLLNYRWDWQLKFKKENMRLNQNESPFSPSEEELKLVKKVNKKDFTTYKRACKILENSLHCQFMDIRNEPRGSISSVDCESGITGWAFHIGSIHYAEIEIVQNESIVNSVKAVDFRAGLAAWGVPRHGYIGFRTQIKNICSGDQIEIREKNSGICLDRFCVSIKI